VNWGKGGVRRLAGELCNSGAVTSRGNVLLTGPLKELCRGTTDVAFRASKKSSCWRKCFLSNAGTVGNRKTLVLLRRSKGKGRVRGMESVTGWISNKERGYESEPLGSWFSHFGGPNFSGQSKGGNLGKRRIPNWKVLLSPRKGRKR